MARSIARQAAMQLVYQRSCGGELSDDAVALVYEHLRDGGKPSKEDLAFIGDILSGVQEHQKELDRLIAEKSSGEWTLDRVSKVDLCILRVAVYELFYRDDVPDNVSISEAMEMAGRYSEPKSGRYINGVLGAIERGKRKGVAYTDGDTV
ncbi:MAG: transcription antitermination factor NusB [Clostridiales bacterium]|nr:transcription antitermination factor NusB [Clostridiales bacterium]